MRGRERAVRARRLGQGHTGSCALRCLGCDRLAGRSDGHARTLSYTAGDKLARNGRKRKTAPSPRGCAMASALYDLPRYFRVSCRHEAHQSRDDLARRVPPRSLSDRLRSGICATYASSAMRGACDSRRRVADRPARECRARWRAPLRHCGSPEGDQCERSCGRRRAPRQAGVRAVFLRLRRSLGRAGGAIRFRCGDQARHAVDFEERDLVASGHYHRAQADHRCRRACRQVLPGICKIKTPGWDSITLRHLLTMSSGITWEESLPWTDPRNDEPHLGQEPDPIR